MKLPQFQVDAFASRIFQGNPAAVVPLESWLSDELMQSIAMENQLSETAFFVAEGAGFRLRWFTPTTEVDLCGHATLATAHVLFAELGYDQEDVVFESRSGALRVVNLGGEYEMDFPADALQPKEDLKTAVEEALGHPLEGLWRGREDLMAVLADEESVRELGPDFRLLSALPTRGVLATARGGACDFVSRCFFPAYGIDEDPVTGSAHTTMASFWAKELGRTVLTARQLSHRGGELTCEVKTDRVHLRGKAVTFLRGEIEV